MPIRLHLSTDDVVNVRFRPEPQPMQDAVAIVRSVSSADSLLHPGLDPARVAMLGQLVAQCSPAFASPPSASLDAGLEGLLAATSRQLARDLDDVVAFGQPIPAWAPQLLERRSDRRAEVVAAYRHVHRVMVEPYAAMLADHQLRVHHQHMRRLAASGLSDVLNHLHPAIRWDSPVLSVDLGPGIDFDVELDGRGLALCPTVYGTQPSVAYDELGSIDTTIEYPVARPDFAARDLPSAAPSSLAAVVGQTRANALVFLAHHAGATTSALATGLDVSAASASEQLTVLRSAGLTRRVRKGPAVSHSLTPLGWSLVAASRTDPPAAVSAPRR